MTLESFEALSSAAPCTSLSTVSGSAVLIGGSKPIASGPVASTRCDQLDKALARPCDTGPDADDPLLSLKKKWNGILVV